jgi:WD40 repeat protein
LTAADSAEKPEPADRKPSAVDAFGDPLPPGALARLGTIRWRHGARASVLAYASGGKEIVTTGPDGVVRVWDATSGKELRRLGKRAEPKEADAYLRPAALSADGKRAATTTTDGVRVWDVETGKELRCFKHDVEKWAELVAIALTPDGKGLLISSLGKMVLWDVATGKERKLFENKGGGPGRQGPGDVPQSGVGQVTFSPDGKLLAAPVFEVAVPEKIDVASVGLWDVTTGKHVRTIGGPAKDENVVLSTAYPAFSADGKVIARVGPDGTIRLHDIDTGKEKRSLGEAGKEEIVAGLTFAPGGKTLAALLGDGRIRLYDTANGKLLHTLADGPARPADAPVQVIPLRQYDVSNSDAPPLAFSPDGKTLAVVPSDNAVRLWDPATGKPVPAPVGHSGAVAELAVSPDGKAVVSYGTDGTLRRWERATGKELSRVTPPGDANATALSPTGRLLAYTDATTVRVRDVAAKKDVVKIELPDNGQGMGQSLVDLIRFSNDEKVLAITDLTGAVRLCDAGTGKALRSLKLPPVEGAQPGVESGALLSTLEFSRDGRTLLGVQLMDGGAALAAQGKAALPLPPPAPGPAVAEEPKSRVCLWDTATGTLLRHWDAPGRVMGATFTPDGRAVATATADQVAVWEVATGKERFHSKGAAGLVSSSPDGRVLAAAGGVSGGTTVRLLDLRTGKEFGRLEGHDAEVEALVFAADGKCLVSGSADSTALVWGAAALAPPARRVDEQSAERLNELWSELLDKDASKAFRAAVVLEASPNGAATLLGERIKPIPAPDAKQLSQWIADLDNDNFEVREKASVELGRLRELARHALEEALKSKSAERRRRAEDLLDRLKPDATLPPDDLRRLRAIEVLEKVNTADARKLLQTLSRGAEGAWLTREAKATLERLDANAP